MYLVDTLPHCLAVDPICCIRSTCINEQKLLCVALKNSFNVILRDFKSGIMCKVLTCHPSKLLDMMVMKRVKYALFMVDMFRNYILFCILFKSIKRKDLFHRFEMIVCIQYQLQAFYKCSAYK